MTQVTFSTKTRLGNEKKEKLHLPTSPPRANLLTRLKQRKGKNKSRKKKHLLQLFLQINLLLLLLHLLMSHLFMNLSRRKVKENIIDITLNWRRMKQRTLKIIVVTILRTVLLLLHMHLQHISRVRDLKRIIRMRKNPWKKNLSKSLKCILKSNEFKTFTFNLYLFSRI